VISYVSVLGAGHSFFLPYSVRTGGFFKEIIKKNKDMRIRIPVTAMLIAAILLSASSFVTEAQGLGRTSLVLDLLALCLVAAAGIRMQIMHNRDEDIF